MTGGTQEALRLILMYGVAPLWLAAGFADWWLHRASRIEATSGTPESLLHLLQLAEMGLPVLAALFLEVNAAILLLMVVSLMTHEASALWDVHYAIGRREVGVLEQHVHSFLEVLPLMGTLMLAALHWEQATSLFGPGDADFGLRAKPEPLPAPYLWTVLTGAVLFAVLPYAEELWRCVRHTRHSDPTTPPRQPAPPVSAR
jgi:hypothetical protein